MLDVFFATFVIADSACHRFGYLIEVTRLLLASVGSLRVCASEDVLVRFPFLDHLLPQAPLVCLR